MPLIHANTPEKSKHFPSLETIAARLNLRRNGREWRGACPVCGYPAAFVLSAGRHGAIAWCASCQNLDAIRAVIGGAPLPPRDREDDQRARDAKETATEAARRMWDGAATVTADDPAGRYLASRNLAAAINNPVLHYRRDVAHPSGGRWPAMICRVGDEAGELVAVHRVFLTSDGAKARIDPPKAAKGPVWGGAIRFNTGSEIVVAEGPETAIAAGLILGLPAWSAISAGNLAKGLKLPADVRRVVIAADHDKPGIDAAQNAMRRWRQEGRIVRMVLPDIEGEDFADVQARRMGGAA